MSIAANGTASQASGSFGGTASPAVSSFSTGALMLLAIANDTSVPATPAGWTSIGSNTVGAHFYRFAYRVKQAGDSAPACGGGTISATAATICAFTGANYGQVSTAATATTAGTSIDPTALTLGSGSASVIFAAAGAGGISFTFPSGWTSQIANTTGLSTATAVNLSPGSGSVDPAAVTCGSAADRVAYQVELTAAVVAVNATPNPATGAGSATCTATAATVAAPNTAAGAGSATASAAVPVPITATTTAAGTGTGSAEVGPNPTWKAALRKYKAGQGVATVVAIGDSLTEGYYAGANVRSTDGWPVRAGLNLSRLGDPSIHPGVYLPTNWATITQTGSTALFLDPSGSDPWTRAGQVNNFIGQRGLGDKIAQLYFTGGTLTTTAPAWATHALIHFTDDSTGSGSVWQALSNGVLVYSHVMDGTPNEQTVLVPLQGAGNTFALNLPGAQGGNGNPSFSGVVWQQRKNAPITPMYAAAAHNTLGGATSITLSSITTGALMVAMAAYDSSVTPALPAGWTSLGSQLVGVHGYRLCYRIKQAGDTTVTFSPGGTGSSDVSLVAFNGASVGQVTGPVTATATGTTISPPAMDATSGYSWSLLALGAGQSGDTVTFPTGWTQQAISNSNTVAALGTDQTIPADLHLAPGNATLASNSAVDRIAWQVEITQAATPVTESFVQVIENGHGGYEANSYANPASGALPPLSQDTSYYWAEAAGRLKPDLVAIYLGYNDIAQGRTAAQFQTDLQTMVTKIDLKFGYQPDLLFIIHLYLAGNSIGFTHAQWDAFVAAMQTAAASYGIRARVLKLEDYWPPSPGPDAFTTLEPGTVSTAVHPTPFGHRTMGDIIAGTMGDTIVSIAPASTAAASSTVAPTIPQPASPATVAAGQASATGSIPVPAAPNQAAAVATATGTGTAAAKATMAATAAATATLAAQVPGVVNITANASAGATAALAASVPQLTTATATAAAVNTALGSVQQWTGGATAATGGASLAAAAPVLMAPPALTGTAAATVDLQVALQAVALAAGQASGGLQASVAMQLSPAALAAARADATGAYPVSLTAGCAGVCTSAATAAVPVPAILAATAAGQLVYETRPARRPGPTPELAATVLTHTPPAAATATRGAPTAGTGQRTSPGGGASVRPRPSATVTRATSPTGTPTP